MKEQKLTLIFLSLTYFTDRDYVRYGVEVIQNNEISVEIWCLGNLLLSNFQEISAVHTEKIPIKDVETIEMFSELVKVTSNNVIFYPIFGKRFQIFRVLAKYNKHYIVATTGDMITSNFHLNFLTRFAQSFKRYIRWFFQQILIQLKIIKAADIWFMSTSYTQKNHWFRYYISKKTKRIPIHSFDYDNYLLENKKECKEEDIIVFLDEYGPFHSDFIIEKTVFPVSPDYYYAHLTKYFDYIEKKTGFSVVIAAHPRSDYNKHPDYFHGRKIIKGKTVELVRKSKCVLTHASTSISYGVLYQRPIIFLHFIQLENIMMGLSILNYAKFFDKDVVILDNPDTYSATLSINNLKYKTYKNRFIKNNETKNKLYWGIVIDHLKKLK